MLLCWAALALAVLSKGPVALILAGGAVMLYVAVMRDLTVLRRMHVLIGLPLFLAITAPWFALVQLRNPTFAEFFFVHENLARFLTTVHHREGPVWYFLPFLALGLSPWLWSLRSTATAAFDSRVQRAGFNVTIFLSLWCLLVLVFFSVSQSKLPPYILPIMPALAVLLAPIVAGDGRAAPRAAWVLGGFFVFLAAGLLVFDWQRDGVLNAALGAWCLVAAGAGLGVILALRSRRELDGLRPPNPWLPHALAATLGVQALIMGYASLAPVRSARGLVADIAPYVQSRTRVYSVGQYRHSASFYLGRALRVVDFSGELEFGIANNPGSALPDVAAFAAEWRGSTDAVAIFAPGAVAEFDRLGLPGRRIAADGRSVAVSRR